MKSDGQGAAIFSRNHRKYLETAVRSARAPATRVAFRAATTWVSASRALDRAESIPIYFAVVGGGARVEYGATLEEVLLRPRKGAKKTQEILRHSLPASANEGLWEGKKSPVRTLYVITNCKRLSRPFPLTHLKKVSDGSPLSSGFRYSYSVVRPVAKLS